MAKKQIEPTEPVAPIVIRHVIMRKGVKTVIDETREQNDARRAAIIEKRGKQQ